MILVFIVYFKEKRDDQMKKKIVEDFNRKSQHKKWTKRKMLNLAISSGLLFTSLAIPVSIAVTSGTISASAAVLLRQIMTVALQRVIVGQPQTKINQLISRFLVAL